MASPAVADDEEFTTPPGVTLRPEFIQNSRASASRIPKRTDLTSPRLYPQAIRKKIESELARKRTISLNNTQRRPREGRKPAAPKGSVAALKPSPALTVPETITVSDASQLCAAKRTDCVLVVDEEEGLSGIFTAKDLAYRVSEVAWLIGFGFNDLLSGHRGRLGSAIYSRQRDYDAQSDGDGRYDERDRGTSTYGVASLQTFGN